MAKKKKSVKSGAPANDATNYAALHWYALTIEQICIQLYATSPSNLPPVKAVLNNTLQALYGVRNDLAAPCGDCQDGWECCSDGMCAPTCVGNFD